MGGMHSSIYAPHYELVKKWPWSRVKVIMEKFVGLNYDLCMDSRDIFTLCGIILISAGGRCRRIYFIFAFAFTALIRHATLTVSSAWQFSNRFLAMVVSLCS